jgi:hypothetical protein
MMKKETLKKQRKKLAKRKARKLLIKNNGGGKGRMRVMKEGRGLMNDCRLNSPFGKTLFS